MPPAFMALPGFNLPRYWPQSMLAFAGIVALLLLLFELGFPLTPAHQEWVTVAVTVALWLGVIGEVGAFASRPRYWRRWRFYATAVLFQVALLSGLLAKPWAVSALADAWPQFSRANLESLYLGAWQAVLLARLGVRALRLNQLLIFRRLPPGLLLSASFLGLILVGACLLKLPRATTAPDALTWMDALFTSTSAVCVTGLTVVDTATTFTGLGQVILIGLMQLGGLGLMTFAYFFVTVFTGVTLKDRTLLTDYLNEDDASRITGTLFAIIGLTFVSEAVGAVLLHLSIVATAPDQASWLNSVFHAVSAFCNAGFSTYPMGLAESVTRNNVSYQVTIMTLIILGGLGFPVLKNLWEHGRGRLFRRHLRPPRLTTHSKTVIVATGVLLVGGAIAVYVFELLSPTPSAAPTPLAALFWSVTARTAGFNTHAVELLSPATVLILMGLMFIGGAPAGTAGGIKVTTFAVAALNTVRILRTPSDALVAFGRSVPATLANRAFALALLAFVWVGGTTVALVVLMPEAAPLDAAFEAVSAFATVGLTRGLTFELPAAGKMLLILTMIVGRIGILYAALSLIGCAPRGRVQYPEANIIIT